jgi:hypothetical protein
MVFEAFTMVFETETMGKGTNTKVSKPETLVLATGTMVFLIKKIVCFAKTIVFGIGTMVCVKKTRVTAAKKTVSVALVVDHLKLNKSEHSPETGTMFAYLNIIILGILNEIIALCR